MQRDASGKCFAQHEPGQSTSPTSAFDEYGVLIRGGDSCLVVDRGYGRVASRRATAAPLRQGRELPRHADGQTGRWTRLRGKRSRKGSLLALLMMLVACTGNRQCI